MILPTSGFSYFFNDHTRGGFRIPRRRERRHTVLLKFPKKTAWNWEIFAPLGLGWRGLFRSANAYLASHVPVWLLCNTNCVSRVFKRRCWPCLLSMFWLVTIWILQRLVGQLNNHIKNPFVWFRNCQCLLRNHSPWIVCRQVLNICGQLYRTKLWWLCSTQ